MIDWEFMGLGFGETLTIVVALLVLAAAIRYAVYERPRDRAR